MDLRPTFAGLIFGNILGIICFRPFNLGNHVFATVCTLLIMIALNGKGFFGGTEGDRKTKQKEDDSQ